MSVAQDRPNKIIDSASSGGPSRASSYSDAMVNSISNKELFAANEGSYFVALSATPGTGVIGHAAPTTFDETKPYLIVYNGGQNRIALQYLRFHETVVSTGATRTQWTFTMDDGNRLSSAGTAATINNVNMASSNVSGAAIKHGAPVATAASATRRLLGHYSLRGSIDVVEDTLEFCFGGVAGGQNVLAPTTVMAVALNVPPVIIGPGQSFMAYQWSASQSAAPTLEMVLGFIER